MYLDKVTRVVSDLGTISKTNIWKYRYYSRDKYGSFMLLYSQDMLKYEFRADMLKFILKRWFSFNNIMWWIFSSTFIIQWTNTIVPILEYLASRWYSKRVVKFQYITFNLNIIIEINKNVSPLDSRHLCFSSSLKCKIQFFEMQNTMYLSTWTDLHYRTHGAAIITCWS